MNALVAPNEFGEFVLTDHAHTLDPLTG
jgi:hypothetical protein